MAAPPTQFSFLERLLKSRLVTEHQVNELFPDEGDRQNTQLLSDGLVKAGLLTRYHVQMLQAGKHRGFFLGPYKILRPIGQGGMGTVFLAEHTTLSRRVAVKVLPPDKAKDKLTLERFNREARAAAALDHPNIVRLHDISQGNGVNFLVMEYVDGNDLQSLMGQTGPLHYAQAAQYIAQAAAGLHHAHEKGFIHRDIKPANLILTKQGGSIKILDMGLARSFTDKADNLTADLANGDIAGTIDYLSPEQAMNMPLDERSDIYSLGATFYALVAGYPPFKGTTAQKLMQHQLKEPPSVSLKLSGRVPQALSDVVSKMMAKKPSERFQSAADVLDALGPWLPVATTGNIITDPSAHTPMPGTGSMTRPIRKSTRLNVAAGVEEEDTPFWKKPAVLIGGGVGLLLLVAGIITAVALSGGGDKKQDNTVRQQPVQQQQPNTNNQNPPPKSAYKVPYTRSDFAGLQPASQRVGGTGKGDVVKAIGGQQLPLGVIINHFNGQAVGEYSIAEVNGATAIGLKQTNNKDGVQVHFFNDGTLSRLPDGAQATLRLTYLFDGTGEGLTFYELTGEPYTKYSSTKLPNTGGKWKAVDIPFTRPVNGKGYEFVVNVGAAPHAEGTLYVRSAEILSPDAAPPVTGAVYEFDAAKVAPFTRKGQTAEQNGPNELKAGAPGWTTEVYDKAGQGNFTARNEGGVAELGVAATGERNVAQLVFRSHELNAADPIEEGKKYTVIIEYRTDKNIEGFSSAQTMDEWNTLNGASLTDTGGEWKTVSYSFTRPAGKKVQMTIGPKSPTGGYVWLRRFYVTSEEAAALAPAGGKTLYALDLTGQKAFTRTGSSEATGDPAEDVRFVEKSRTGQGDLPTGWRGMPWDRTSVAAFFAEEKAGKMAFGMKNVKTGTEFTNGFTGMLFSPKVSFTGPFRVRFTYLTDCDYPKAVQVKFKATAPTPRGAVALTAPDDLPGTGGKWVTKEIEVNPNTSTDGYIEFHLFDADTNRGFYLSEMSVIGPGQPAEAAAPQPKSNVPVDPVKADFAAFKDGTFPLTSNAASTPLDVPGWSANQFAGGDTGELVVSTDGEAKVLTLVNKTGQGSAQVYQSKVGPALSAGAAYMLKVEYKAADGTSGKLEVREKEVGNWKDCPYSFKLDATGDKWEKRTFELEATRDYPTVFVIQNLTGKTGNKLSIRSIEIVPLGGGR